MDDLISRQATYLALVEKGQASKRYKLGETWELNGEEIREVLDALPSAQPKLLQPWEVLVAQSVLSQPDIIRCRECKFASGDSRICMKFGHSPIGELDFCAWAERRTDE